jgi:hypothetical protein
VVFFSVGPVSTKNESDVGVRNLRREDGGVCVCVLVMDTQFGKRKRYVCVCVFRDVWAGSESRLVSQLAT